MAAVVVRTAVVEVCHKINNLSLELLYTLKITLVVSMPELFQKPKIFQEKSSFHLRNSLSGQPFNVRQGKSLKIHEHAIAKRRNLN